MKYEEITLSKTITRKIDRLFKEAMLDGVDVDQNGDFRVPVKNMTTAQNLLISELTGLTIEQVDSLEVEVFNQILEEIKAIPNSPMTALSQG